MGKKQHPTPKSGVRPNTLSRSQYEETKARHQIYLGILIRPINLGDEFSQKEVSDIIKRGAWMSALANGNIEPFTAEQRRFANVFRQKSTPNSYWEKLWMKYLLHLAREENKFNCSDQDNTIESGNPPEEWMPRDGLSRMMPSGYYFHRKK